MIDYLWTHTWVWLGAGGLAVIACGVVAYFIPPLRRTAIGVGGIILAAATIYAKGARDARKEERAKSEKAVRRIEGEYGKIDARTDTDRDVDERLRGGKF